MPALFKAIGLMSGTSMDGVDVALIETDGHSVAVTANGRIETRGRTSSRPYDAAEQALLGRAKDEAKHLTDRDARPGCLAEAEALVTASHAEAVEAFLRKAGLAASDITVVGFHGQTVDHRPAEGLTVQIGDGQALADRLGIPVVYDFRADDVAAGGQGAPLVPVFHKALAEACGFALPLAVLNIGGVANVTFVGEADDLIGFDTGPGNALLNDFVGARLQLRYDDEGRLAAAGQADEAIVDWILGHPYFRKAPPKSLDRDSFSPAMIGATGDADGAATLTSLTVRAIAGALAFAPQPPRRWIVGGGGAKNNEMMRRLRALLDAEVTSADEIGWTTEFLEAQAFAYLAARRLFDLPITFPSTTGVARPLAGGKLVRPR